MAQQPPLTTSQPTAQNTGNQSTSTAIQMKAIDWRWIAGPILFVVILGLALRSLTTSLSANVILWALIIAILLAGIVLASKKNDIGTSLIKYSLVALGLLLLATWLGIGNITKVGQNIGDTLAGNIPPRTTTRPAVTQAPLPQLQTSAYLDNIPGYFPVATISSGSSIGPVNDYDDSCLKHAQAGGSGQLVIMTRPDFTSAPVRATLNANGVVIPGHAGAAYQYFYCAEGGEILLNLQRREGDRSC